MGYGAALMVAALDADVVELRTVGHLDFQHLVEAGGGRAVFSSVSSAPASSLTQWWRIASEVSDLWT